MSRRKNPKPPERALVLPDGGMVPITQDSMTGLGFETVKHLAGSTFKESSVIVLMPMRGILVHTDDERCRKDGNHTWCRKPMVHMYVKTALDGLIKPMNQKSAFVYTTGHEVGHAYNEMIRTILADPNLSKWKYILTIEDDNIVPPDALIRLLESMDQTKGDAVSGLYFTKGSYQMPMAYGSPEEFRRTGVLDFRPLDVRGALEAGNNVIEVNGIACGCALWRLDLFREVPEPWYVTMNDIMGDKGPALMTQDLAFCQKARLAGKRFFVDLRVKVGHLDIETGIIY